MVGWLGYVGLVGCYNMAWGVGLVGVGLWDCWLFGWGVCGGNGGLVYVLRVAGRFGLGVGVWRFSWVLLVGSFVICVLGLTRRVCDSDCSVGF